MQMLMKICHYATVGVCWLLVAVMLPVRLIVACWVVTDEVLVNWLDRTKEDL